MGRARKHAHAEARARRTSAMGEAFKDPACASIWAEPANLMISINACAALLLLQLLAFVFATVVTVVLNVSVVCTVAVAVAVLDTVIFLLWTNATSPSRDTEDVEMT